MQTFALIYAAAPVDFVYDGSFGYLRDTSYELRANS